MQTPAILNISSPSPAPAAGKPATGAPNASFDQMLSRQLAERRASEQSKPAAQAATASKSQEARNPGQAGKAEAKQLEQGNAAGKAEGKGAAEGKREEQLADSAGNVPTATELLAQTAAALLAPQADRVADGSGAIPDADATAAGSARTGRQALLATADDALQHARAQAAGDQGDFRASLHEAAELNAAADAADDMHAGALNKTIELATAEIPDSPAVTGAVAQMQAAVQDVGQLAGDKGMERLTPRVGTPAWDQAVGQKVVWMVAGAQQSASLTLNPPDLGPLQVVLNVSNGQADASFYAAQPEVRQALEAALPKLRDMMSEAGVALGQASVSAGMPDSHDRPGEPAGSQGSRGAAGQDSDHAAPVAGPAPRITAGQGLVDTFA